MAETTWSRMVDMLLVMSGTGVGEIWSGAVDGFERVVGLAA